MPRADQKQGAQGRAELQPHSNAIPCGTQAAQQTYPDIVLPEQKSRAHCGVRVRPRAHAQPITPQPPKTLTGHVQSDSCTWLQATPVEQQSMFHSKNKMTTGYLLPLLQPGQMYEHTAPHKATLSKLSAKDIRYRSRNTSPFEAVTN